MEFKIKIAANDVLAFDQEGLLIASGPHFNDVGNEFFQIEIKAKRKRFGDGEDDETVATLPLSRKEASQLASMLTSGLKNSRGDE